MGDGKAWQQDYRNFHLQMPDNGTYLSPQAVRKPNRNELALLQANRTFVAQNAISPQLSQSPTKYHHRFDHVARPQTYKAGADYQLPESQDDGLQDGALQMVYNVHPSVDIEQNGAPVWISECLNSSDDSQHSHGSQHSNESYHRSHPGFQTQSWVSSPPVTGTHHREQHHGLRLVAPVPQRIPHQLLYQQQEQLENGLGIHYVDAEEIGTALPYGATYAQNQRHETITPPAISNCFAAYPPLPPYPSDIFSDASPFTTPRKQIFSVSRSPSPSVSPTRRATSQGRAQRSPSRSENTHNRRKSLHKAGPIKEHTAQDGHRRTRSSSRPPRTPRTPKTPTSAGLAQLDFVNYTSRDSAKLMNDVAPSGSSKTRARREQEAKDKRKRLSEAAMQAIRRAGGDVRALEEAIFV